jgi:hypothetical protein
LALLIDNPINVRIRPTFGLDFRPGELPRLINPVIRLARFCRFILSHGRNLVRAASDATLFGVGPGTIWRVLSTPQPH